MKAITDWFQHRNWKPFRYQRDCWNSFLNGESGLIHAPTGYGKTYAAWLGPVARYLASRGASVGASSTGRSKRQRTEPALLVWITPLRALAGDTCQA
ncbi:MAG: DEAD/DEAH box helicase, partial [Phycisphaerae bacterium]